MNTTNVLDQQSTKKRKSRTKSTDVMNEKKYECHCGRKYLSYSALYIHSKQKHGVTITTKNFQTRNDAAAYPTKTKAPEPMNQNGLQQNSDGYFVEHNENIQRAIVRFVNMEGNNNAEKIKFMYWTFEQLIMCINSNSNLLEDYTYMVNYTEKKSPALVPLIFNFFICDYCPKTLGNIYESNRSKMEEIIWSFGEWLVENRLTQFEIQRNNGNENQE